MASPKKTSKKTASKKAATKTPAKKAPKKAAAKKAPKKATAKKATAKKATSKKSASEKAPAAKKSASEKAPAEKASSKPAKSSSKKAPAKKKKSRVAEAASAIAEKASELTEQALSAAKAAVSKKKQPEAPEPADLKTRPTDSSVADFLEAVPNERRRADAWTVSRMMEEIVGEAPQMWGGSIVGFGSKLLRYESGREVDWMLVGFSPRKAKLVLYIMPGFERYDELLAKLGKHETGKSCLYIGNLGDIDLRVLAELIAHSVAEMRAR